MATDWMSHGNDPWKIEIEAKPPILLAFQLKVSSTMFSLPEQYKIEMS